MCAYCGGWQHTEMSVISSQLCATSTKREFHAAKLMYYFGLHK